MKQIITYEKLKPTSVDGNIIKVSMYFSSFDTNEIDTLHEYLKNNIGTGLVTELILKGDNNNA